MDSLATRRARPGPAEGSVDLSPRQLAEARAAANEGRVGPEQLVALNLPETGDGAQRQRGSEELVLHAGVDGDEDTTLGGESAVREVVGLARRAVGGGAAGAGGDKAARCGLTLGNGEVGGAA